MSSAAMTYIGYTIHGPPPNGSIDLPYRSPSIRREPKLSSDNLRLLYRSSASPPQLSPRSNSESVTIGPTTPILPPTPPHVEDEDQENHEPSSPDATKIRSMIVTPVNQQSPPTPEITPPREPPARGRKFLGTQPSMASTHAESFKTAHEDIVSDAESDLSVPRSRYGLGLRSSPYLSALQTDHRPSPLAGATGLDGTVDSPRLSPETIPSSHSYDTPRALKILALPEIRLSPLQDTHTDAPIDQNGAISSKKSDTRQSLGLRERLEESKSVPRSPSVDKFASIIGWSEDVHKEDNKRWSGMSASTVEAIVLEAPYVPKKRGTLRHVTKNDSLRSVSSPLPRSDRATGPTKLDSPHRLVHKKGKVTNQNRFSFGSEKSRSLSISSSLPAVKPEIIKVAVIPERVSSLAASDRSRHDSNSTSSVSITIHPHRGSDNQSIQRQKKRTMSDTGRGRDRYYPPPVESYVVPPRSSSLSAPTSRNTSRANSLTSDHVRLERKKAERELRTTLSRMESERLASSLKSASDDVSIANEATILITSSQTDVRAHDFAANVEPFPDHIVPGTQEWAALRPPSILTTPFSAPSFLSASPEISEAKIVNFFPHNNHSLQLIEPLPILESRAVRTFRKQDQTRLHNDSPFRDPRAAPQPPTAQTVPPTPQNENFSQLVDSPEKQKGPTKRRPSVNPQDRADSFAKALMKTVSLRNARNKKADQDLDSESHPMWRPQPFWDDADARRSRELDAQQRDRGVVQNSVGIPVQRNLFSGPVGLMHRLSNRRRDRKALAKQTSYSSLQRIRTGRKLFRVPRLGMRLQLVGFRDIQDKIIMNRHRKEDEQREKRREELRRSIGPNVISTGDSRFPTTTV